MSTKSLHHNDIELKGNAYFESESKNFYFTPLEPVSGQVDKSKTRGTAIQLSDGSFDFVASHRRRSQAKPIKKLKHGRLSKTSDGGILLWIKVNPSEGLSVSRTIVREAKTAVRSLERRHKFVPRTKPSTADLFDKFPF